MTTGSTLRPCTLVLAGALVLTGTTVASVLRAQTAPAPAPAAPGADGYYTVDQAIRGRFQFNRHCGYCHTDRPGAMSADSQKSHRGFEIGGGRQVMNLAGTYLRSKKYDGKVMYPSVYHVFNRVESMPANDVKSIGDGIRTDIVAYLLQANGFPPGPRELPATPEAMKAMPLDEPGFSSLFNGRDFSGMKFFLGPNCVPAPEGCGNGSPDGIYSVRDGVLVCTGRVHGYWYTEKRYLNFTLRFEYRYVPPPNWSEDDATFSGQSGYHLFVTEHGIWPKAIEIQGRHYDVLSPIGVGSRIKMTDDVEARRRARRPVGAWNTVEIVSRNGEVRSSLNGVLLSVVSEHPFKVPGHIAFESQGTEIQWRSVRIKEE